MSHQKKLLKSYKLINSEIKVGDTINSLYAFKIEEKTILGYVSGYTDRMVLRTGFEGYITFWDMGFIYKKEKYPNLYLDKEEIFSVSLLSKKSQDMNDNMLESIYG